MRVAEELDSIFDAQAFVKGTPSALRALRVRIQDGNRFVLSGSLGWDYEASVEKAFDDDVRPMLIENEACYILFRTATWALMTFAPEGAHDSSRYIAGEPALREGLGGAPRIPNVYTWRTSAEVTLHTDVVNARPLSFDKHMLDHAKREASSRSAEQGDSSHQDALPSHPPPHTAVGNRVVADGLVAKPQYNGLVGTVTSWDSKRGRAGVKFDHEEGGAALLLKPANLRPSS